MNKTFELAWLMPVISLVALLLLARSLAPLAPEQCPRIVFWFLMAQLCFTACTSICGTKWANLDSYYWATFGITMLFPIVTAQGFAISALVRAKMPFMVAVMLAMGTILGFQVARHWWKAPWPYLLNALLGAMFIAPGIFLLISLDVWINPTLDRLRLVFGLFLLTEGIFYWLLPEFLAKDYAVGVAANSWVGPFIAIGSYVWLGFFLHGVSATGQR